MDGKSEAMRAGLESIMCFNNAIGSTLMDGHVERETVAETFASRT